MGTYTEFEENISKARELIRLASLKELMLEIDAALMPLKRARLLPEIRPFGILPSPEDIRMTIKDTTDKIYEVGLPQILVYAVSCLEAFLKDQYCMINPSDKRVHIFLKAETIRKIYSAILRVDIFGGDEDLLNKLNSVFQKRHVIVHKAGVIDEKSCKECGWDTKRLGMRLRLDSDSVNQDIDVLEQVALKVHVSC